MTKSIITVLAGVGLTAGLLALGAAGASADDRTELTTPKPPKGARAVVQVSPNPTTKRGEEITITGHCGGGKRLKAVLGGVRKEILRDVRIIDDNPKAFVAKATLDPKVGNGVGPILVDCDGEAGVTLLVTHV
ncbi:hypothetical protein SAMN05444920_11960 [Nonomuraea solani]|uniref:Neocarzinostatin family protein n=1 Tax=Nonomuraea solani TaxID=1144553 RepID=A0A1H6ETD0_9ACTN|nr:hypothetical protein [Nonomuraea solani]SEH01130.1 hypothetical protein SAMN05444920_11960 [Nonomuraea solani]